MRPRPTAPDRGGFALALVVLMLFAVAVAGATGYQVVSAEFSMAQQNRDGQEALAVARAGLQRFVAEQIGVLGDSVSYAIGDGVASVTARRVFVQDTLNHLYYIKSVGQVADPRTPLLPATRSVGTYAWHRLNPIRPKAAMILTGGQLWLFSGGNVRGADHATSGDCSFGGTVPRYGVATAGSIRSTGGTYTGTPSGMVNYADFNAAYDTVGIRWDILSDPSFPVDFQNMMPNWGSLPADSFPIIRFDGNLNAWGSLYSGRGVLIVSGTLSLSGDFRWDGIILAGRFYYSWSSLSVPRVQGIFVGNLSSVQTPMYLFAGDFNYHSCNAYKANRSLSYLELAGDAVVELNP